MLWFTDLPLDARYGILALLGLIAGSFANYLIYSWAYYPRHISPWAPPCSEDSKRTLFDRVPILGWLTLRREASIHGRGFWIRPLLIELAMAIAIPALYWFETQTGGLLPAELRGANTIAGFSSWGHSIFAIHAVILTLMMAATFIDFDEQTIPDIITLPGTLFAIVVSLLPWRTWLPAQVFWNGQLGIAETMFNVPFPFDPKWQGTSGLVTGLFLWTGWCFALADRRLIVRRGWAKAFGYFCHGLKRNPTTKWLFRMWLIGATCVISVWWWAPQDPWRGLLTSLVGLAVGGGSVWAVRIVASAAMRQEAMGFGDVTLMAMIGAVVGWQCALAAFFLAPIAAILIVLIQYVITRQPAVPFGPYLCVGTAIAVVGWDTVWNQTLSQYVSMGAALFWILVVSLVAMGVLLFVWRLIKRSLFA